jgi:hypothetical protein
MGEKPKYERPLIVPLNVGDGPALGACSTGSVPGGTDPSCSDGATAALGCKSGSLAYTSGCMTGGSPTGSCWNGNGEYYGCGNGNQARTVGCWNGNGFGANPCFTGGLFYRCSSGTGF